MPAGYDVSSNTSKKKEAVSKKIQEIKQRQQNWLKQRDNSKEQVGLYEKSKASVVSQSKPVVSSPASIQHNVQNSNIVAKKVVNGPDKNNVREKFKHWIDVRNPTLVHYEDVPDFNDSNSLQSGAESELERLFSPEQRSVTQPVSEEEFGYLAEKIASKVKKDLGIPHSDSALSGTPSTLINFGEDDKPVWKSSRCRTFTKEVPTFNHLSTSPALSSHNCIVCHKLMLSSKHIPTMVIPCGHTFCKSCLKGKQICPLCDCPVLSLTMNIMLQQVIQEYYANHVPSSLQSESVESIGSSTGKKYIQARYVEDKLRNGKTSCEMQLENLETRYSILFTERKTLVNTQKQLTKNLQQEQVQIQNIMRQEEEVEKAILDLQERAKALQKHRQHFECQVTELQDEKSQLERKITLLSTTITSLTMEMEKVKLLSEVK